MERLLPFVLGLHFKISSCPFREWSFSIGQALHDTFLNILRRNFDDGLHRFGSFGEGGFLFGRYDGGTAKYGKRDQRFLHLSYIRVVRDGHYLGMCIVS